MAEKHAWHQHASLVTEDVSMLADVPRLRPFEKIDLCGSNKVVDSGQATDEKLLEYQHTLVFGLLIWFVDSKNTLPPPVGSDDLYNPVIDLLCCISVINLAGILFFPISFQHAPAPYILHLLTFGKGEQMGTRPGSVKLKGSKGDKIFLAPGAWWKGTTDGQLPFVSPYTCTHWGAGLVTQSSLESCPVQFLFDKVLHHVRSFLSLDVSHICVSLTSCPLHFLTSQPK